MSTVKPLTRIDEFQQLTYGMFVHWGLYSIIGKGEWVQNLLKMDQDNYTPLMNQFTASKFDARLIARFAKSVGVKYITLTTRHHDGFSLYDTKGLSDYDVMHSPANRDLVLEFADGCREEGVVPVFYHTTLDWYQKSFNDDFDAYLDYLYESVKMLTLDYGQVGGFWFDGNWSKPDSDWKWDRLYGMIRKNQPQAIIVDNTGLSAQGEVAHHEIDSVTFEQGKPFEINKGDIDKYRASEMCQTLNWHWGHTQNDYRYKSPQDLINAFCDCRKAGANYLLNIGLDAQGEIPEFETAILRMLGRWINLYKDAIYGVRPSSIKSAEQNFAVESKDGRVFLFIMNIATLGDENVTIGNGINGPRNFQNCYKKISSIKWLDNSEELDFVQDTQTGLLCLNAKGCSYGSNYVVRIAEIEF